MAYVQQRLHSNGTDDLLPCRPKAKLTSFPENITYLLVDNFVKWLLLKSIANSYLDIKLFSFFIKFLTYWH